MSSIEMRTRREDISNRNILGYDQQERWGIKTMIILWEGAISSEYWIAYRYLGTTTKNTQPQQQQQQNITCERV